MSPLFMPLWVKDYLAGTRHLRSAAQHGAYLLLILGLWEAGGRLAADDATLAGHACCTAEEWAVLKPSVLPFFRVSRGRLTHKRVSAELAKACGKLAVASKAGKASAAARAQKRSGNGATPVERPLDARSTNRTEQNRTDLPEDKSSGADAPLVASPPVAFDPDARAWETAKQVLTQQGGMKGPEAARYFGGLLARKKLMAKEMLPALDRALVNATRDPQSYLRAAAEAIARRGGRGGGPANNHGQDYC